MSRSKKRSNVLASASDRDPRTDENDNVKKAKVKESIGEESIPMINQDHEVAAMSEEKTDVFIENDDLSKGSNTIDLITLDESPVRLIQTSVDQYFPATENSFQQIKDLVANTMNFRIRCKIIHKSVIRSFGMENKVFDAIVCDSSGEIKVVAFNDQVDRLYELLIINRTIIIEDGNVKMCNLNFRTRYSTHEILLLSNTNIQLYNCSNFKPTMTIMKKSIRDVLSTGHNTLVDLEGIIIMNWDVITTTSASGSGNIRRKALKIKDETSSITITFWNNKIDQMPLEVMNKKIRIRNGKINHYNDYVSINVFESSMVEFE